MAKKPTTKSIETLTHEDATRKNIPTAEYQSVMRKEEQNPVRVAYERRNRDLDPQLVWRGKDLQDWSDLVVHAPPLYIQEKIHPKVLIDDLLRQSAADAKVADEQIDLFADFNGIPEGVDKTEFYQHDGKWQNRMILGDSLHVMASLTEREGLRGKVQCIYLDPPYGIKFNSNFQWSTTSRDVRDGNTDHITREPEQVKAFRDTWRDGIHSYLTYLRDRLTVARELLTDSGSIFVQIGDENVHRVRAVMDEVFGEDNFITQIDFATTTSQTSKFVSSITDHVLWFSKDRISAKFRKLNLSKDRDKQEKSLFALYEENFTVSPRKPENENARLLVYDNLTSRSGSESSKKAFTFVGRCFYPNTGGWKTSLDGLTKLGKANRIGLRGDNVFYKRYFNDYPYSPMPNTWMDTQSGGLGVENRIYVVQTNVKVIERCILMSTDPGDLVLDPTCGSGTTAYVAEQWGRRWITIDTSRVALALARARIMGARYPYYLLADSRDGQIKEAEITRSGLSNQPTRNDIRQGFVYERVPHITLKSIANNAEIDIIWEKFQQKLEPLRQQINSLLKQSFEEWQIPREADPHWPDAVKHLHAQWWQQRIARQQEIDASIAAKADYEYLYDKPYEDKKRVRVAGSFTVESLSPHRVLGIDEQDELINSIAESGDGYREKPDFAQMILDNLKIAGVQQAHKEDRIAFTALMAWPGELICAEGRYFESATIEKRAAIFIGPEFGTVSRPDLVAAAREAGDADFDVLIACAFNYDARSTDFAKLGRIPVLKARMNADLHMADDLKTTDKGNLFVIFGEPDITILDSADGNIRVKVNGVDVFHPQSGEIRSAGPDGIACWFIDTDYNEESFFVRHAYFLGASNPYQSLKTTLKAEINEDAWATLNRDVSRPFAKPASGRIAVKVINHLGDEVMKVFRVAPGI